MKKRTQFPFVSPISTFKFLGLKRHLILLFFSLAINFGNTQDFDFTIEVGGGSTPTGYCTITTLTLNIENTGGASTFSGRIEFYALHWRIIDNSELPNLTVLTGQPGGKTHYVFTTPTIGAGKTVSYVYQFLSTPFENYNPKVIEHYITRDVNSYQLTANVNINNAEVEPIPQPGYSSIRISDILDDYENSGPLALFPLFEEGFDEYDLYDTNPSKSQRLYIEDELICDIPEYSIYNGENDGYIVMEEGSRILVEEGSILTIDGQSISSCTKMWKGIYVEAGATLLLNNCTVANAQYGITAERGATVICQFTRFEDCYVGFYVAPYTYAQDPEHPEDTYVFTNRFLGNLFIGTGSMLPPYSGQSPTPTGDLPHAGIEVSNLSSFILPGTAFNQDYNAFENLSNGIIVKNCSFSLWDASFKDIVYDNELPSKLQGYGIYVEDGKYSRIIGNSVGFSYPAQFHFDNVTHGIYNSKGALEVTGTTMEQVSYGINSFSSKNRRIKFENNTILGFTKGIILNHCMPIENGVIKNNEIIINREATANDGVCIEVNDFAVPTRWLIENNELTIMDAKYCIYSEAGDEITIMNNDINVVYVNEDEGYGIHLQGTNNPVVTCNDINGDADDPHFHESEGIRFESAHQYNISCNTIDKFRRGIRPIRDNTGDLFGNEFTDHYHGLYLAAGARTGIQKHPGNLWYGDFEEEAAIHNGNIMDIQASLMIQDMNTPSSIIPPSVYPLSGWFNHEAGTAYSCIDSMVCPEGIGYYPRALTWDSVDIDVVNGDLGFENYDAAGSWNYRLHLFRRLIGESVPGLPTEISTFLTIQQDSNIGKFSNSYDSLFYAIKYHGAQELALSEYPSHLSRIFDDVFHLDTMMASGRYNNDSLSLLMVARYDSIFQYEYNFLQKDSIINSVLSNKIDSAIEYIEDIDPDSIWQEELQFTLLEFLHLAKTDSLLSSSDIYNLAISCPDKYGDAVYHARSLIRVDSSKIYYDDNGTCNYLNPRTIEDFISKSGLLYPNPATNQVSIESNKSIDALRVYSLTGNEIPVNWRMSGEAAVVNVSGLASGVYYIKTLNNAREIGTYKFVIAR